MAAWSSVLGAAAVLCLSTLGAGAQCIVADPTGTELNVRTAPNGRVVGSLYNGQKVAVLDRTVSGGKPWVYVGDSLVNDQPIGWVFAPYVVCRAR